MASAVDICNLALAHLGDSATVSSIDPPEGSAQAGHCKRFYPIARDTLLAQHQWSFATKRKALTVIADAAPSTWGFAYAEPADLLTPLAVLAPDAGDDLQINFPVSSSECEQPPLGWTGYQPQDYTRETQANGIGMILTDQEDAHLRYVARITDTTRFSPPFVDALAWLLASHLAGPVIKGENGVKAAQAALAAFVRALAIARDHDANQQQKPIRAMPTWIRNR